MSIQVYQESYTEEDFKKYQERITEQLTVLDDLTQIPGFGGENYRLSAAIHYYLTDKQANVAPISKKVITQAGDSRLQMAINKFNLELEISPVELTKKPFSSIHNELLEVQELLDDASRNLNVNATPIGILPTLKRTDIHTKNITDTCRNRALDRGLNKAHGQNLKLKVDGKEPLIFHCTDATLEGINGAMYCQLKTPLKRFTNTWNALQLITPIVVGVAANSPRLFDHLLWHESRIALFNHVSYRNRARVRLKQTKLPRINYGQDWLSNGPWQLFSDNVALYEPLLPVVFPKDARDSIRAGELPSLDELRLHQSTVWTWNRAIFDTSTSGQFQIQNRCLPAGPSNIDMLANVAFMIGLTLGLRDHMNSLITSFPFTHVEANFYQAARSSLDAKILWPDIKTHVTREHRLSDLASQLLPTAERGLSILGVDNEDIVRYLDIIQRRLDKRMTGARWQMEILSHYFQSYDLEQAQKKMLDDYILEYRLNNPVSDWELP